MSASNPRVQVEQEELPKKSQVHEELVGLLDYIKMVVRKNIDTYPDYEDVASEVFLSCLRSVDSYRGNCTVKTWVYRIILRRVVDYIRVKQRRRECGLDVFKHDGSSPSVEFEYIKAERQKKAREFILVRFKLLSERQREIYRHVLGGLSLYEVAEALQITPKVVLRHYNMGLYKLRSAV